MKRLGIFGGTFDPPHLAHLILADEAIYQLDLDRVLWVLTPISPLKPDQWISPWRLRLELLETALSSNPAFEVSRVDIDRSPPHYTYETIQILSRIYSTYELVYLMGADSLNDFPIWNKPEQILAACDTIGVMARPGEKIDMETLNRSLPGIKSKISWIDTPLVEISASAIREKIKLGEPGKYYLPSGVYELIQKLGLYQEGDALVFGDDIG